MKTTCVDTKEVFLTKKVELFPPLKEETIIPSPQGFLKYKCELYLKQSLTPPQCKIIVAYCTSNHRLTIDIGQWTTIPILEILDYATFAHIIQLEMSLESFFQVDHQVDISLYLMETNALCHSRNLVDSKP